LYTAGKCLCTAGKCLHTAGKHVVTYTATDVFGNSGGCSFTFTV